MAIKAGNENQIQIMWLFSFRYYRSDQNVKEDVELQAYLNEVSLDGTGPNGGIGQVY